MTFISALPSGEYIVYQLIGRFCNHRASFAGRLRLPCEWVHSFHFFEGQQNALKSRLIDWLRHLA